MALLLLNLAACCGVFESASGLERPRLWNCKYAVNPSTEGYRVRLRQAKPFFVEQARQPTHEPPDDFVDLVWSTVQLSQWGGKDPQLLVFGLVSSSYLSAASRDVAGEQHNTNKSDVTVITAAHDGSAPTPLEFSPNKPFRLPELSSVQAQYMYLSSFTIIKTLFGITVTQPRRLLWCF